eukprot:7388714-Prymnesium_polylepis.2
MDCRLCWPPSRNASPRSAISRLLDVEPCGGGGGRRLGWAATGTQLWRPAVVAPRRRRHVSQARHLHRVQRML